MDKDARNIAVFLLALIAVSIGGHFLYAKGMAYDMAVAKIQSEKPASNRVPRPPH